MIYTIKDLINLIESSERTYDIDRILLAYEIAEKAHNSQFRISGDPYISHPIAVAMILVELGMDTSSVCAALMHDVVEDTEITLEYLTQTFDSTVSHLVDGVTKIGKIPLSTKEQQQAENIRKMLLAMSEDVRVIIIKLADRLHNMRTLGFMKPQKQRDKSLETIEIYAPIAHRLGITNLKEGLEDLALYYLDPVAFEEIERTLASKRHGKVYFIDDIKKQIEARLEEYNLESTIYGRVKSLYGIYKKVYMTGGSFDEVYDIYAVRIIVNSVIECYNILGIIHDMFRPIPNRFKDYISTPKPNMYQSLHTTVIGKASIPFEVQIRTWDMHKTAEYGIAAHWKYKAGIQGKNKIEERLAWINQILASQKESEGAEDLIKNIKTDLSSDQIFVFTPKGDVKSLPIGSTIVDFAYSIHSAVGNKMVGAKVDGRMVSLNHKVSTGEIIDIITSNNPNNGPNRDWIKIAQTSEARNKIRAWFKKEKREENIIQGKQEFERELKRNLIHLKDIEDKEFLSKLAKRNNYEDLEDFYAAIGYGGILLSKLIPIIKESYKRIIKEQNSNLSQVVIKNTSNNKNLKNDIIIDGLDNCLIKYSQCCNPLPGDDIIGFVTRGHGVSVHKTDCINVLVGMADEQQKGRWLDASWNGNIVKDYRTNINILAKSRDSLLVDISVLLSNFRVGIQHFNAKELKNGEVIMNITIGISNMDKLKNIIQNLAKISGIISVKRN